MVTQEQLTKGFDKYLTKAHKIVHKKTKAEEIKAGEFKGLQIVVEKQHNKTVNRITGLETFGFTTKEDAKIYQYSHLVKLIQEKFNVQVATHDVPKSSGKVQGR